jgi:dTDP-4-dehydrorhamnose 3,5-epimerase
MKLLETPLKGAWLIEPKVFNDDRGFFLESYNQKVFEKEGLNTNWVQDNHSRSSKGVLRGLHFQNPKAQIKLVRVTRGSVLDVIVDIRKNSPTFGKSYSVELSEDNKRWLYVPVGFAHGFCVLTDVTDFLYKCSEFYSPEFDKGVFWNDPDLEINWQIQNPLISPKDAKLPRLRDIPNENLPLL